MDDRRLGLIIRALRRRLGWRQIDLAARAGVSQPVVSRAERGHLDSLTLRTIRRLVAALDVRLNLDPRWRAGEIDRVADERHARLVRRAIERLIAAGWLVLQEISYSIAGERGSIDLLAVKPDERIVLLCEVKAELVSWEETLRRLDPKLRLLPRIVSERLGWRPLTMGSVLILDETTTNRRRVAALGAAATQQFPQRTRDVLRWLRCPDYPLRGLWFLPSMRGRADKRRLVGAHRIRRPRSRRVAA